MMHVETVLHHPWLTKLQSDRERVEAALDRTRCELVLEHQHGAYVDDVYQVEPVEPVDIEHLSRTKVHQEAELMYVCLPH